MKKKVATVAQMTGDVVIVSVNWGGGKRDITIDAEAVRIESLREGDRIEIEFPEAEWKKIGHVPKGEQINITVARLFQRKGQMTAIAEETLQTVTQVSLGILMNEAVALDAQLDDHGKKDLSVRLAILNAQAYLQEAANKTKMAAKIMRALGRELEE